MKFRFALVIVALLLCAGLAPAATVTWNWGDKANDPNGTWTDPANWGGTVPGATDTADFPGFGFGTNPIHYWTTGAGLVTINSTVSVGAVIVNTADMDEYTFLGTGQLNVAGNFTWDDTWYANFQPVLNVGGALIVQQPGYQYDNRMVITFGTGSGGSAVYTAGDTFTGGIQCYDGAFLDIEGNNTTFGGTLMAASTIPAYAVFGYSGGSPGTIAIGGTGDTFLANTTLDLEYGGAIRATTSQNFTNVTNIIFNGGTLRLDAANSFPSISGFDVVSGVLAMTGYTDACLGADTIGLTLGGPCTFGYLMGGNNDSDATTWVTRPITLAGNGGVIDSASYFYNAEMNLATNISGPGTLIKSGDYSLYMHNPGSGTNSYSGGTIIVGGRLWVDTAQTLGTGNVSVPFGGDMYDDGSGRYPVGLALTASTNMAAGTSVYLGHTQNIYATLVLDADFAPNIDPTSTGTILLGTNISSTLTSIGECFMAGDNNIYSYLGATFPVGTDGVYRIGGVAAYGSGWWHELQIGPAWGYQPDMLSGNNSLLVQEGGAKLWQANSYTGTTTIVSNLNPNAWNFDPLEAHFGQADPSGNYSALGSTTGNVVMQQGALLISNDTFESNVNMALAKGNLSFEGMNYLFLNNANNGNGNMAAELDVTFASLTRVNNGVLNIDSYAGSIIGIPDPVTGFAQRVFVTAGVPTTNNMAPPYYVGFDGAADACFLNYTSASGFISIVDSAMTALSPVGANSPTDLALSSGGTALTADANVWALKIENGAVTGSNTVTIGSGGLIITNINWSQQITANLVFGSVASPTEAVITTPDNGGWFSGGGYISGNITANGLTKTGIGNLWLAGSNPGLTGKVVITAGYLYANSGSLGNASEVVIDGGGFAPQYNPTIPIAVGPLGGWLMGYGTGIQGPIVNDPAFGGSGLLYVQNNTSLQAVNTWTGGLDIDDCYVRMDDLASSYNSGTGLYTVSGTPGLGPIIITGPGGNLVDYTGYGWSTPARVSLLGAANTTQLSFEWQGNNTGPKLYSFGSLEGEGDIVDGGYNPVTNATLQIGTDNTNSEYFGRIYETSYQEYFAFTKVGTGTLTMWGVSSWHGATNVNGGTLEFNGELQEGTFAAYDVQVNNGGTLDGIGLIVRNVDVNTGGTLGGYGHINVNGYVNVNGGTANMVGSIINGGMYVYSGSYTGASTITGDLTVLGGTFNGTNTIVANSVSPWVGGFPTGMQVVGGVFGGNNTIIGSVYTARDKYDSGGTIQGSGTVSGNVYIWSGAYNGTYAIAGNVDVEDYWGSNMEDGNFNSSFAGQSTIGGNVTLGSIGSTGTVSFTGGHTIAGSLTVVTGNTQPITISPHNAVTGNAGTITVGAGMKLDSNTKLNFNLGTPGTPGGGINDLIDITGSLSLDGTLNVNGLTGFNTGTYTLFTYTGALSGAGLTLGTMPSGMGYTYSIDTSTFGQVNLDVVLPWQPGDTNRDGLRDSLDIDAIYHNFGAPATSQWKVDGDGNVVGQGDVTYELHTYFHTNYGDANLDTKTDFSDFQILLDHWQVSGPTIGWAQGDFNGTYSVDFLDFQVLLDYWNPGGWSFAPAQTPEPASLTLLLLGGLALLRRSRKA